MFNSHKTEWCRYYSYSYHLHFTGEAWRVWVTGPGFTSGILRTKTSLVSLTWNFQAFSHRRRQAHLCWAALTQVELRSFPKRREEQQWAYWLQMGSPESTRTGSQSLPSLLFLPCPWANYSSHCFCLSGYNSMLFTKELEALCAVCVRRVWLIEDIQVLLLLVSTYLISLSAKIMPWLESSTFLPRYQHTHLVDGK